MNFKNILVVFGFVLIVVLAFLLLFVNLTSNNISQLASQHPSSMPSVKSLALPNASPIESPHDGSDLNDLCGQGINATIVSNPYIDLGNSKLSTLDERIILGNSKKRVSLVDNNISQTEQKRIIANYPNVKFDFFPQNYDSYKIDSSWEEFTSPKANIKFMHHPQLSVEEETFTNTTYDTGRQVSFDEITIKNSFVDFEYYWRSCASPEAYINMTITWDKESSMTIGQYANELAGGTGKKSGNKYIISNEVGMTSMLGLVEDYSIGNFQGLHIIQGEATNETYITKLNNRFYTFTMRVGGETGSTIGTFPKKILEQVISSVEIL